MPKKKNTSQQKPPGPPAAWEVNLADIKVGWLRATADIHSEDLRIGFLAFGSAFLSN